MMLHVFKIFRLLLIAVIITYFIGSLWWYLTWNMKSIEPGSTSFSTFHGMDLLDKYHRLIISCHFALTTLSTVGYGDFYPVNNFERIFAVFVMLGGVAFFSYIMGNFVEIITQFEKKMG